jgi:hypothetical protein
MNYTASKWNELHCLEMNYTASLEEEKKPNNNNKTTNKLILQQNVTNVLSDSVWTLHLTNKCPSICSSVYVLNGTEVVQWFVNCIACVKHCFSDSKILVNSKEDWLDTCQATVFRWPSGHWLHEDGDKRQHTKSYNECRSQYTCTDTSKCYYLIWFQKKQKLQKQQKTCVVSLSGRTTASDAWITLAQTVTLFYWLTQTFPNSPKLTETF